MRNIKLPPQKTSKKKSEEQKKKELEQDNSHIIYFGLGDYERIDNYLRGLTKDI